MEISVKQCVYCEKHVPKRDPNNFSFIKEMICYNCWLKLPLKIFDLSIDQESYRFEHFAVLFG